MDTILAATDFSDSGTNAVNYAIELAKYFGAKLVLVNSYPMPYSSFETGGMPAEMISIMQDASIGGLNNLKHKIEQEHKHNFNITCYSEMGFADNVIIEIANKVQADLIVMGIVGDGETSKMHLIGSTAIKVARSSTIPTFIIPNTISYHPIKNISFACNLDKTEESDLIYLNKLFGKMFNAQLEIIHVEEPNEDLTTKKAFTYSVIEEKLNTIPHKSVFISSKKAGEALENYFKDHTTDLIIINPRKHDLFHNLFSHSVSKELAFHCKYPLLCVQ